MTDCAQLKSRLLFYTGSHGAACNGVKAWSLVGKGKQKGGGLVTLRAHTQDLQAGVTGGGNYLDFW